MKEIFLLRHGNTDCGARYIGSTDVNLSSEGIEEIRKTSIFLRAYDFDRIICSPLIRCRQTCRELHLKQSITTDDRIREINFGRWEEKTFKEIKISDPALVDKWASPDDSFGFPEGEKIKDFISRIQDFSNHIQSLKCSRVLVVTHGGVIRHLICSFLHLSFKNYLYFQIKPGRITTIDLHGHGGIMTGMNLGALNG